MTRDRHANTKTATTFLSKTCPFRLLCLCYACVTFAEQSAPVPCSSADCIHCTMTDLREGLLQFGFKHDGPRLDLLVNLLTDLDFTSLESLRCAGRFVFFLGCIAVHVMRCCHSCRLSGLPELDRLDIWDEDIQFVDSIVAKINVVKVNSFM